MNVVKLTFNADKGILGMIFNSMKNCCEFYSRTLNKHVYQNNIMRCMLDIDYARTYLNEPTLETMTIYNREEKQPTKWYCDVCRLEMLNTSKLNHIASKDHQTNFNMQKNPIIENMKVRVKKEPYVW
jgi:hypothetical protein